MAVSIPTYAQRGQVVTTQLTSPALEGNKLGDSATRRARVYLPPSYETSTRRYPVAYFLHGLSGNENEFFSDQGHLSAEGLIQGGMMDEMIIVGVDGRGGQPVTGYLNSELNGDYEDYIAQDLVEHIDATFRTIADRDSRAIFGASYGGQATLYYAMMHSDVFGAAYAISSGIVTSFSRPGSFLYLGGEKAEFADFANAGNDLAGVEAPSDIHGFLRSAVFGMASAHSPNLDNPPLNVDLPFEVPSLAIIPEVRDKWLEYDLFLLLEDRVAELSSLRGLALDVGDGDGAMNIRENTAFHEALVEAGVPHQFEVFSGGHRNRRSERIRESLAFLSDSLIVLFGDFNGNSALDAEDIDLLSAEVRQGTNDRAMDVTGDGVVDERDHWFWVKDRELAFTYFGDSNLDGEFNSGDLITVFQAGEYEDDITTNSGWGTGDWNGDAEFDSGDLVFAFQDGGYEQGTRVAKSAVPEPASFVILMAGLIGLGVHRHKVSS